MSKQHNQSNLLIHLSILFAILLTLFPWPEKIALFQPHWVALLIAYWSLYAANTKVMFVAFAYGLILDILMGSLLGKHGMSLVALSFLVNKSAKKLRMTSFWQLLMMVMVWLFNDIVIRATIDWISYRYQPQWQDLIPLFTAAFIWPWLKYLLDRIQTSMRNS